MDNNQQLKARLVHAVIGQQDIITEEQTSEDSTPLLGEIVINDTLNNFKIGDGGQPYSDLPNIIPEVNNATLTIQQNGTTLDTFTANSLTDKTINITVPTVNDATLTIYHNNTSIGTFSANASSNVGIYIDDPVSTLTSFVLNYISGTSPYFYESDTGLPQGISVGTILFTTSALTGYTAGSYYPIFGNASQSNISGWIQIYNSSSVPVSGNNRIWRIKSISSYTHNDTTYRLFIIH